MRIKFTKTAFRLAVCIALAAGLVRGDDDPELTRPSLKGLKGVTVDVRFASTTQRGIQSALTDNLLRTDVELKLRKAGIPIMSAASVLKDGGAFLAVHLNIVSPSEAEGDIYAFSLRLEVEQPTVLMRTNIVVPLAVTWSTSLTGVIGRDRIRSIRDSLSDLTDKFLNAYLSVNPK